MHVPALAMAGAYDYRLVVVSVLIAMMASYAALDLAGRVMSARGVARTFRSRSARLSCSLRLSGCFAAVCRQAYPPKPRRHRN
jgi:hypothetical protein